MSEPVLKDGQVSTFDNASPANQLAEIAKKVQDLQNGYPAVDTVDTAAIVNDAVTTDKIDNDAVTTAKILDANVTPAKLSEIPFHRTATITSAAAATPVSLLDAADVPATSKVYIQGFIATVSGATAWGTTATVKIQDTNGTAVDFVTMAVAALTGNAVVFPSTSNVTIEAAYKNGTGGTLDKGLQLKGDANGTGSDLKVTVWGVIK